METIEKPGIGEKVIERLHKMAADLEAFRLQATLGKYEARDAYEFSKKKFAHFIDEAKRQVAGKKDQTKEITMKIINALELLQVQLALGKVETKEAFEKQRARLVKALDALEGLLRKSEKIDDLYISLHIEIEKFRIKLEILKLRFALNKFAVKEEFEIRKKLFSKKLKEMKKAFGKKEGRWEDFKEEVGEAYDHLRKAFLG